MIYNFEFKLLESLDQIIVDTTFHYQYQDIDFLYNNNTNNKNLVVAFHGAKRAEDQSTIFFRGYDWIRKIPNSDMLCISDRLFKYSKQALTWFLDTKKYKQVDLISEIIGHIIKSKNYENIIFHGSSGGAFPALRYASMFNSIAYICNGQLYLDRYSYFKTLVKILEDDNNSIDDTIHISEIIKSSGKYPKRIILHQNTLDAYHFSLHSEPFFNEFKDDPNMNITYETFEIAPKPGGSAHSLNAPNGKKNLNIIRDILDEIIQKN
jgi:hypothetical protein